MNKNLIEIIAANYGLKINDHFKVIDVLASCRPEFKITEDGLVQVHINKGPEYDPNEVLVNLILGKLDIIPVSRVPVKGESYYTYDKNLDIIERVWEDSPIDFALLISNLVFTSKDLAIKYQNIIVLNISNQAQDILDT